MPRAALGHLTVVSRDPRKVWEFTDALWARLRREAEEAYVRAPQLAPLFLDSITNQPSFEDAVCHRAGFVSDRAIEWILCASSTFEITPLP